MMAEKILVVEDEWLIAYDIKESLEVLGYQVPGIFATAEEVMEQIQALQPDLVLMDIQLAGETDGIAASEQIQAQFDIPVVYLTANADRKTLERVKRSEPFGYILKPFNGQILSTAIDIALSRHQAEVNARQAQSLAELELQSHSEQIAMMSHELRNPLGAIQISVDILERFRDRLSDEKITKHLKQIQSATQLLSSLVEDVLFLEKVKQNRVDTRPESLNILEFCQELVELWTVTNSNRCRIQLMTQLSNPLVFLDKTLLWHVLNNLLSNATKYSDPDGFVGVRLTEVGEQLSIIIEDHGIGIPEETQAVLFSPFVRAGNAKAIAGTGLGLTIVKRALELLRGEIEVTSRVGQGTCVSVIIPRSMT